VPQRGDDLQLDGAGGEVVDALLRHQAHEVAGGGDALCSGDVPAGEVAAAEVDHVAGSNKLLHRLPDLLPRRASVDVVHLVQVDVVGLQSTQTVLARRADVVSREAPIIGSGAHRLVQLGGEHDLVATPATLGQPAADVFLRDPVTLLHVGRLRAAVNIGGVDKVDTGVYGGVQHGEAVRLASLHAEVQSAQPDPADLQTSPAQIAVLHAHPFFMRRPAATRN
jgi:hypothetical protein